MKKEKVKPTMEEVIDEKIRKQEEKKRPVPVENIENCCKSNSLSTKDLKVLNRYLIYGTPRPLFTPPEIIEIYTLEISELAVKVKYQMTGNVRWILKETLDKDYKIVEELARQSIIPKFAVKMDLNNIN